MNFKKLFVSLEVKMTEENNVDFNEQIYELSNEIIIMSKNSLIVSFRYMDVALSKLKIIKEENVNSTCTDGEFYFYNPSSTY